MKRCPDCKKEVGYGRVYCPHCSAELFRGRHHEVAAASLNARVLFRS
jgi:predicted amidophosphoribosyltransferase